MKNKRYLFLSILFLAVLAFPQGASAQTTVQLTTYYPSPFGVYQSLRLQPEDNSATGNLRTIVDCPETGEQDGTFYVEMSSGSPALIVCDSSAAAPNWLPAGGVWNNSGGGGPITPNDNTFDVTITTNLNVTNDITVGGNINLTGDIINAGDGAFDTITVADNSTLGNGAGDITTISDILNVGGATTMTTTLGVGTNLTVNGNTTLGVAPGPDTTTINGVTTVNATDLMLDNSAVAGDAILTINSQAASTSRVTLTDGVDSGTIDFIGGATDAMTLSATGALPVSMNMQNGGVSINGAVPTTAAARLDIIGNVGGTVFRAGNVAGNNAINVDSNNSVGIGRAPGADLNLHVAVEDAPCLTGLDDATCISPEFGMVVDDDLQVFGSIVASGELIAGAFVYSSDENLKENYKSVKGLEGILELEGYMFDWKHTGKADIGLTAQNVEKVYPDLVSTNKETGRKYLKYGNLIAPLIEAIKDQQEIIEQQNKNLEEQGQLMEAQGQLNEEQNMQLESLRLEIEQLKLKNQM